ncbi:NDMA-dependent alcohol dehydrogenase [Amycolatopsis sacchari]|uniref:S-(Hydroxymethyl)glutathione dehydrogenase / alcohol dehydrogenase n=1 Tax=Amycolatopsis sacchari TaxID=115433 RepID=A0A1I3VPT2_9PSEU|nr:NDMA-dependent alcohol dehydrogenase [Amycolatopsis sacchari]SFJ97255.1 S-(hydroxymethyl)glutathione dehydrogenase / alcohol dehydrogenase [Amycolatopsis sacchari]
MRTRAAIIRETGKPWEVTELELDDPREGEVRIRFAVSGMCHSDEHLRTGDSVSRLPIVGGHEGAGVVEATGPGVTRVRPGDRVVCSFIPACGVCRYCSTGRQNLCDQGAEMATGLLPGGGFRFHDDAGEDLGGFCMLGTFAEHAVVSQASCVKLDDDIPFEVAALTGCGVPTGWGSSVYVAGVRAGDTVVVFGCGGVGSNAVQGAAYAGAKNIVVVDPVPFKRGKAEEFGATHVFADAASAHEAVVELTRGQLADHAICTVGVLTAEVVSQATAIVGKDGQVTVTSVGRTGDVHVQLAANGLLVGYQRRVQGHVFGKCNPLYDIPKLHGLYRAGRLKLDELITRRYPLDEINQGYADLDEGRIIRGIVVHGQ